MPTTSTGCAAPCARRLSLVRAVFAAALIACVVSLAAMLVVPRAACADASSSVGEGQQLSEGSAVDDEYGLGINDFERRNKGREDKGGAGYIYQVNDTEAFVVLAVGENTLVMVPQDVANTVGFKADDQGYVDAFMAMVAELDEAASKGGTLVGSLKGDVQVSVGEQEVQFGDVTVRRDVSIGEGDKARLYGTLTRTDGQANNTDAVLCDYGHLVANSAVVTEAIPTWWESLRAFLSTIDYRPLWVSLKTSGVALVIVFICGLLAAWKSLGVKSRWQGIVDTLFTIPMVLPPTVCGYFLLPLFGTKRPLGIWLSRSGIKFVMNWYGGVLAAAVVAFPLMYRTARGAFESFDETLSQSARTLGLPNVWIFWRIRMPYCRQGILAGTVLAFARALGEYGATSMLAGYTPGKTATVSTAVYQLWQTGNDALAFRWVLVNVAISAVFLLTVNLLEDRQRKEGLR